MTFEELLRAAADRGIRLLHVTKRTDGKGYEASARRKGMDAYAVHVDPDPIVAIAAVIMEDDEHLTRPVKDAKTKFRESFQRKLKEDTEDLI